MSWLDNESQLIVGSSYVLLLSTNGRLSSSVRAVEADPRVAMITRCPAAGPAYTGVQTNGARPRAMVLAGTSTHPLRRADTVLFVSRITFLIVLGKFGMFT